MLSARRPKRICFSPSNRAGWQGRSRNGPSVSALGSLDATIDLIAATVRLLRASAASSVQVVASSDPKALTLGPFRLLPCQPALFEGEKQIRLGRRALSILMVLVERAGSLVSNEELLSLIWSDASVEEGSLRVHIFACARL